MFVSIDLACTPSYHRIVPQGEDWTDEESLVASEGGRGGGAEEPDMVEMLYGQGVPAELLDDVAMDKPSVDQIDDEERMNDPMVLVDIKVCLVMFRRERVLTT